jgi:hypothetical protein
MIGNDVDVAIDALDGSGEPSDVTTQPSIDGVSEVSREHGELVCQRGILGPDASAVRRHGTDGRRAARELHRKLSCESSTSVSISGFAVCFPNGGACSPRLI